MGIQGIAGGGVVATGHGVSVYQAIVLKGAIKMWVNHGMRANRAYTPTNMLRTAGNITGKAYKRGQLPQAQADLEAWIEAQRGAIAAENVEGV